MKVFLYVTITLGVIILFLFTSQMMRNGSIPDLTDEAKSQAPYNYVELSHGAIHYELKGPEDGPVAVLVHGFSTPLFIYEQNVGALLEAGFRVLRFDHYGRGWSDRPKTEYDADLYDRTLIELLDALQITQPVHLVGLSMGGIISAEFTVRHPERVKKLVLLVPAGLTLADQGLRGKLLRIPLIGDYIWDRFAVSAIANGYDESAFEPRHRLQGKINEQFKYRGVSAALLSTFRNLPMANRDSTYAQLEATNVPIMAIFGTDDDTVLIESSARLRALAPSAKIIDIDGAGHGLNFQNFETVNPLLVEFLTQR